MLIRRIALCLLGAHLVGACSPGPSQEQLAIAAQLQATAAQVGSLSAELAALKAEHAVSQEPAEVPIAEAFEIVRAEGLDSHVPTAEAATRYRDLRRAGMSREASVRAIRVAIDAGAEEQRVKMEYAISDAVASPKFRAAVRRMAKADSKGIDATPEQVAALESRLRAIMVSRQEPDAELIEELCNSLAGYGKIASSYLDALDIAEVFPSGKSIPVFMNAYRTARESGTHAEALSAGRAAVDALEGPLPTPAKH